VKLYAGFSIGSHSHHIADMVIGNTLLQCNGDTLKH